MATRTIVIGDRVQVLGGAWGTVIKFLHDGVWIAIQRDDKKSPNDDGLWHTMVQNIEYVEDNFEWLLTL